MHYRLFLNGARGRYAVPIVLGLAVLNPGLPQTATADDGQVEFNVVDSAGEPLPCRIHLLDDEDKPRFPKDLPFWRNHFSCPGTAKLQLPAGAYRYRIERGPEYHRNLGSFTMADGGSQKIGVKLERLVDMAADGWFSGDMHVHRPHQQMKLLMRSEDLHVAPVITWWNNQNQWADRDMPDELLSNFDGCRYCRIMAGEDEREGGALMFFNLDRPLDITGSEREYPSPMKFVNQARERDGVWIDIEKPFWWDVPVWLAGGKIDSVGLANNHMCHDRMYENEAWGRPRDESRLPPPLGNGFWTQEIYYQILNTGLRLPPSAGSASGVLPNPLGYNRVYVHTGRDFDYPKWWRGLKAGRAFVTNGPILLVKANGELPGYVFSASDGGQVSLSLDIALTTLDNVPKIEIIKNGRVAKAVSPAELAEAGGSIELTFDESGWFLVRAITDLAHTFRFASTAPYYVEIDPARTRVSRRSVQFFLDWIDERIARIPNKLDDPDKLAEVLAFQKTAKSFWQDRLANANAD